MESLINSTLQKEREKKECPKSLYGLVTNSAQEAHLTD